MTNLEKENVKVVQQVNSQVKALKETLSQLADIVSDEIDQVKKTLILELDSKINHTSSRIESFSSYFSKVDNDYSKVNFEIRTIKEELGILRSMDDKKYNQIQ